MKKKLLLALQIVFFCTLTLAQSEPKQIKSALPHLQEFLSDKPEEYYFSSGKMEDYHPDRKNTVVVNFDKSKDRIRLTIIHTVKYNWFNHIVFKLELYDDSENSEEFGTVDSFRATFQNNCGITNESMRTFIEKRFHMGGPNEAKIKEDLQRKLQVFYEQAASTLISINDDSSHQKMHELFLRDFFYEEKLIDERDLQTKYK